MNNVLLTGAAGGIGGGILEHLGVRGFKIIATDHPAAIKSKIRMANEGSVHWVPLDFQGLNSCAHALQSFEKNVRSCLNGSPLEAIIHNAAIQRLGAFEDLTIGDWQYTLEVNLLAPVTISRMFMSDLIKTQGSVIHISSIHSHLTKPGFTAYATSKAAISGLTRAMAVELGDRVRINAIEPAAIRTPMLEAGFANYPAQISLLEEHHPTRRIGTYEDVARAVVFLLDPANSFLNGCVLELGGGIHARLHDPL